jgi:hypothetical protein
MEHKTRQLVEIFGYSPTDTSRDVRKLWEMGACPFLNKGCIKHNHDQSIIYGTCSVTSSLGNVVICPNRLYANTYASLHHISKEAYGDKVPLLMFNDYVERRAIANECVVALGMNSGKEVKVGRSLSMDWVLVRISKGALVDYTGVEVQSIDITGNYRDAWHAFKNYDPKRKTVLPSSGHGLNWANVHKRLIPQIIRKGLVFSRSHFVTKGLFFIVPEIVYQKFEEVIGADIPKLKKLARNTITVHTYSLGEEKGVGKQRDLILERSFTFSLEDFSNRFISGPNLPSGEDLDGVIRKALAIR